MGTRSRATLFLMEQLVVILVFALCAATCVRIFSGSYIMASESRDRKNALVIAESVAEVYKSVGGNLGQLTNFLQVYAVGDSEHLTLNYRSDLNPSTTGEAAYSVVLILSEGAATPETPQHQLIVRNAAGTELLSFPVAAQRAR